MTENLQPKSPLWSRSVEKAFLEALEIFPDYYGKRTKYWTEPKDKRKFGRGRNGCISEYIFEKSGAYRSRKQIFNHFLDDDKYQKVPKIYLKNRHLQEKQPYRRRKPLGEMSQSNSTSIQLSGKLQSSDQRSSKFNGSFVSCFSDVSFSKEKKLKNWTGSGWLNIDNAKLFSPSFAQSAAQVLKKTADTILLYQDQEVTAKIGNNFTEYNTAEEKWEIISSGFGGDPVVQRGSPKNISGDIMTPVMLDLNTLLAPQFPLRLAEFEIFETDGKTWGSEKFRIARFQMNRGNHDGLEVKQLSEIAAHFPSDKVCDPFQCTFHDLFQMCRAIGFFSVELDVDFPFTESIGSYGFSFKLVGYRRGRMVITSSFFYDTNFVHSVSEVLDPKAGFNWSGAPKTDRAFPYLLGNKVSDIFSKVRKGTCTSEKRRQQIGKISLIQIVVDEESQQVVLCVPMTLVYRRRIGKISEDSFRMFKVVDKL